MCTHTHTHIHTRARARAHRERERERERTSSQRVNKVHFGIRHPWFLKPQAVIPYPLPRGTPIDLSSRATLSLPRGKTLSTSPPTAPRPFLGLPHRLRYLHPNPPSLFLSLSLLLLQSIPSFVCFSFPRAAPACLPVFLFSSPILVPYRRQSPSPVGTLPTRPLRSPYLPPHPSRAYLHTLTKNPSPVWAQRGVSPFVSFYPLPIIPPLPLS